MGSGVATDLGSRALCEGINGVTWAEAPPGATAPGRSGVPDAPLVPAADRAPGNGAGREVGPSAASGCPGSSHGRGRSGSRAAGGPRGEPVALCSREMLAACRAACWPARKGSLSTPPGRLFDTNTSYEQSATSRNETHLVMKQGGPLDRDLRVLQEGERGPTENPDLLPLWARVPRAPPHFDLAEPRPHRVGQGQVVGDGRDRSGRPAPRAPDPRARPPEVVAHAPR